MQSILDAAVYNQIRAYAKFNRIYLLEKERLLSVKGVVYERAKVQNTPGRSEAIEKLVDLERQIQKSFKDIIECLNAVDDEYQDKILNLVLGEEFLSFEDRKILESILDNLDNLAEAVKIKIDGELVNYEKSKEVIKRSRGMANKSNDVSGEIKKALIWFIRSQRFFIEQRKNVDSIIDEMKFDRLTDLINSTFCESVDDEYKSDVWGYVVDKKAYNPAYKVQIEAEINHWLRTLGKEIGWLI